MDSFAQLERKEKDLRSLDVIAFVFLRVLCGKRFCCSDFA
jgi:hypothetical protein